jgi:hypothetical protein
LFVTDKKYSGLKFSIFRLYHAIGPKLVHKKGPKLVRKENGPKLSFIQMDQNWAILKWATTSDIAMSSTLPHHTTTTNCHVTLPRQSADVANNAMPDSCPAGARIYDSYEPSQIY